MITRKRLLLTESTGDANFSVIESGNTINKDSKTAANLAQDVTGKMLSLSSKAIDTVERESAKRSADYKELSKSAINSVTTATKNNVQAKL